MKNLNPYECLCNGTRNAINMLGNANINPISLKIKYDQIDNEVLLTSSYGTLLVMQTSIQATINIGSNYSAANFMMSKLHFPCLPFSIPYSFRSNLCV